MNACDLNDWLANSIHVQYDGGAVGAFVPYLEVGTDWKSLKQQLVAVALNVSAVPFRI